MNNLKRKELERRIDEVLFFVWDPIGVSDIPAARGEYSSYVITILKYVLEEDLKSIASHLGEIESNSMGIKKNDINNLEIANLLIEVKHAVEEYLR